MAEIRVGVRAWVRRGPEERRHAYCPGLQGGPPEFAPPSPPPPAAGSSRQDVCWEEWGACGDLSQPLLVTGAAGGLNPNPGHQQNNGPADRLLWAWGQGVQGRLPAGGAGASGRRGREGLLRPLFSPVRSWPGQQRWEIQWHSHLSRLTEKFLL